MPSGLGPVHSSRVFRAIYILSVLLVFSYIFFDVLDLDGSNFPKLFAPVERNTIVAVVPTGVQLNYSSEQSELCHHIAILFTDQSGLDARSQWAELLRASRLGTARSHGYRVGLARNSLPDSPPYW
jgi:hypothetical protein